MRAAFAAPVADREGVEAAMARAMAGIVLGGDPSEAARMAEDVGTLFDVVQSPVRRLLLGWRYAGRRRRLYEALARRWEASRPDDPTLLGEARRHAPQLDRRTLLEQIPHWMFTFTRSGPTSSRGRWRWSRRARRPEGASTRSAPRRVPSTASMRRRR